MTKQELVSCPVGANFAVRNLFFNIPARRKFLKSNQTELSNIMAEFERIALAHPDVAFTLQSGSSIALDLAGGNFRQRIVGIFGRRIDKQLVPRRRMSLCCNSFYCVYLLVWAMELPI